MENELEPELENQIEQIEQTEEELEEISSKNKNKIITLQLGDIVRFQAQLNENLDNKTFIIEYIDSSKIQLINTDELTPIQLKINDDGTLGDGTITSIILLYRNDKLGYARQNNLLPGTWINIYFGGELPTIITGEITNLEEDMIEIKTYPDNDILYINFAYKGIPEDLPIETIEIREPIVQGQQKEEEEQKEEEQKEGQEKEEPEQKEQQEEVEEGRGGYIDEDDIYYAIPDESVKTHIREFIISANELQFGEEYDPITQFVNVDESKQRYNIDVQITDLLDEILSTIPNSDRTPSVLNNIHIMIERFKQLRSDFSKFDNRGTITEFIKIDANWKPLVNNINQNFKQMLYWMLPVTKNIKNVYDIAGSRREGGGDENNEEREENEYFGTVSLGDMDDNIEQMIEIINNYKSNVPDGQNKYITLFKDLQSYFTSFQDIGRENNQFIKEFEVVGNLNAIVDNLENFNSNAVEQEAINIRRFLMCQYTTGLSRLQITQSSGSKLITNRVKLTDSDTMTLKSIVTLPEPTITFSHINLPGTNILIKSNLNSVHLNYWQLLKKGTRIAQIVVDNLADEFKFDEENYVNNIKNYSLTKTEQMEAANNHDGNAIADKFLNIIIPKTRVLFNLIKKYIKGKLSLVDVVRYMEPFLIYTSDLTFMQYLEIVKFLRAEITKYKINFKKNNINFSQFKSLLIGLSSTNAISATSITNLIKERQLSNSSSSNNLTSDPAVKNINIFQTVYTYDPSQLPLTSSELIRKMLITDFGNVFNAKASLEHLYLMLPEDIGEILNNEKDAMSKKQEIQEHEDKCLTYIIAKQYSSLEELTGDNDRTIYFDKKYDNTIYSILDDFQKEQIKLSSGEFYEYLANKLYTDKKYKYDEKDSHRLAETLITGLKKVINGDYAVLISNYEKSVYYKRENNQWIIDETIDPEIMANNQSLLCNFQQNCIEVDKKYQAVCQSIDLNKTDLRKNALKEMINEFDHNYKLTRDQLEQKLKQHAEYYIQISEKLAEIKHLGAFKYNEEQYNIGITALPDDEQVDVIASPFFKLRDIILGQADYVKKQNDIIQFATKFTREATTETEDIHWRYCIQTSTKLLPSFLYVLATCFVNDPNNYSNVMDLIIKENGALSDDGDAEVDKYSGYIIRYKDFDIDEGYEEGRKIRSREIMEQDAGDALTTAVKSITIKYDTVESKMMSNIISALSGFMGINIEDQREFMMRIITSSLNGALPTESEYKLRVAEMSKKGKELPAYKVIYNETILYLTLGAFLIGIQVNVPSIKTRKTFPGCIKSFDGYPFEGAGDMSGLIYLVCIAYKIRSSTDPWSVLMKKKEQSISEKLKTFIDTYFIQNQDVIRKFREKNEYILSNPNDEIPQEHSITKWTTFLPPLRPFKIHKLENVSQEFKRTLLQDFKIAAGSQREKILIIESKIIFFSLGIQEKIQKILDKKKLLLTNGANEPFLENACCNEKGDVYNILRYFENEDGEIAEYNRVVQELSNVLEDINAITKSPFLFCSENNKRIYPTNIGEEFTEETIYRAFIVLCKFNSFAPLNPELHAICSDKPEYINNNDSIIDKINKLKQDGRHYTNQSFLRLVQIVNRQNIVSNNIAIPVTPIQRLRGILDTINKNDHNKVVPLELRQHLEALVDTFDFVVEEDTEEMRNMKNYLVKSNTRLKKEVYEFIKANTNLSKQGLSDIGKFIIYFMSWDNFDITNVDELLEIMVSKQERKREQDRKQRQKEQKEQKGRKEQNGQKEKKGQKEQQKQSTISDDITYNAIQFTSEYMKNMVNVFPQIILNKVDYEHTALPKYWNLSSTHETDINKIIKDYYARLRVFYDDVSITTVLQTINPSCKYLLMLAFGTPTMTDISYKESKTYTIFDKRTSLLLYENYLLQSLMEYIKLADTDAMIVREIDRNPDSGADVEGVYTSEYTEDKEQRLIPRLETAVFLGNKKELKNKIAQLLVVYLNIMKDHKNIIDLSYDKIMDAVFKSKEREKSTFTTRLHDLSDEERNIDTMLKINKLGVWSKGLQKGMTTYMKNTYDDERDAMQSMIELERTVRRNPGVTDSNLEQFETDFLEEQRGAEEIERDEYDMSNMNADYMDGDYGGYEEENQENYD